ncbi:MAG: hypothetical protein JWP27_92 [Flaviaesturariibacter sp.]|nr:hypothetical protein [Flaviaesturariibacter sp.]
MERKRHSHIGFLVPLAGCSLYVLLYVVATTLYPGGSQQSKSSSGFSWMHNYWCNLLAADAINGQPNGARPVAFAAMFVLCATLAVFWYVFPRYAGLRGGTRFVVQLSGFLSMALVVFIFTRFHDAIINAAGFFGLIALAGTFTGLRKLRWTALFAMGLVTVPIVVVNNVFYRVPGLIYYLPAIQKASFLYFLVWIGMISLAMYRRRDGIANVGTTKAREDTKEHKVS